MTGEEMKYVQEAFESNFIAPAGPQIEAFERDFSERVGIPYSLAVSSGTAAMHLALRALGVGPRDEVFASDLTFIGSVSPIVFQGATPVFIDSDRDTWNMDPDLLEEALEACEKSGKLPKAVVPTDLYGQCADYERIFSICEQYEIPVVADSAESLGAKYKLAADPHRRSQTLSSAYMAEEKESSLSRNKQLEEFRYSGFGADAAVYSFNGNKIITTSCGGMLVSDNRDFIEQARFFAQQAREPFSHYEHYHIGYNYRMSNILAAIGIGQLKALDERVAKKREIFSYYQEALKDIPGIEFMPEASYGESNRWLTVVLINSDEFGTDRETVRAALEEENIESRPVWKPMHLQPVFELAADTRRNTPFFSPRTSRGKKGLHFVEKLPDQKIQAKVIGGEVAPQLNTLKGHCSTGQGGLCHNSKRQYPARAIGGNVAEDLFQRGLCLPSGTQMAEADLERVVHIIKGVWEKG